MWPKCPKRDFDSILFDIFKLNQQRLITINEFCKESNNFDCVSADSLVSRVPTYDTVPSWNPGLRTIPDPTPLSLSPVSLPVSSTLSYRNKGKKHQINNTNNFDCFNVIMFRLVDLDLVQLCFLKILK